MDSFIVNGVSLEYMQQTFPRLSEGIGAFMGERTVEIPLAKRWIAHYKDIVEVGAVMGTWWNASPGTPYHSPIEVPHRVIDPYDDSPGVVKMDSEEYDYTDLNVLSVSTLEHIGRAEYGNPNVDMQKACRIFEKIISTAKNYLLIWPSTYHRELDECLMGEMLRSDIIVIGLKQIEGNRWVQLDYPNFSLGYGYPADLKDLYPYANGLIVVTNSLDWLQ